MQRCFASSRCRIMSRRTTCFAPSTGSWTCPAFFSYSDNYLIDTDHGVILDVEATRSIRQAEVGSTKTMLTCVKDRFDLHPERLIADTAYGSGPMLGWLVEREIAPHIPVIDKAGRSDGTWSRAEFEWDAENDQYICPEGHELKQFRRNYSDPNRGPASKGTARYRALKEVFRHPFGNARSRRTKHDRGVQAATEHTIRLSARAAPSLVVSLALSAPLAATVSRRACR